MPAGITLVTLTGTLPWRSSQRHDSRNKYREVCPPPNTGSRVCARLLIAGQGQGLVDSFGRESHSRGTSAEKASFVLPMPCSTERRDQRDRAQCLRWRSGRTRKSVWMAESRVVALRGVTSRSGTFTEPRPVDFLVVLAEATGRLVISRA